MNDVQKERKFNVKYLCKPSINWLTVDQAASLCGYTNSSSVSRLKRSFGIRTKPYSGNWVLYYKPDIIKALEKRSDRGINVKGTEAKYLHKYTNCPKLYGDYIVLADLHCPMVDKKFVSEATKIAYKMKIGQLIIAGDFLDCSAHSKFYDISPRFDWPLEKRVARDMLAFFSQEFDSVQLLTANHEFRYLKKLELKHTDDIMKRDAGEELDIWEVTLSKMKDRYRNRIDISIYPYCRLNGDEWRIIHPDRAWKYPLNEAEQISHKRNCSVAMAHTHVSGWRYASDGKRHLVSLGVCADPNHFGWYRLRENTAYEWSETFLIIKDNDPLIFLKGSKFPVLH